MATLSATNILSLAAFKAHASEIINGMKADNRPIVITQNGSAAAVLLPPEEYDALVKRSEFLRAVDRGLGDSKAGRLIDHDDSDTWTSGVPRSSSVSSRRRGARSQRRSRL